MSAHPRLLLPQRWTSIGFLVFISVGMAQAAPVKDLRVATRLVKPFVFAENGNLTGFSIDLWHEIAARLTIQSTFVKKPTVQDLLESVKDGEADVGIAAISITADREKDFDLSHAMFDSGLQILTRDTETHSDATLAVIRALFSRDVLLVGGLIVVFTLVAAHLIWFFEQSAGHQSELLQKGKHGTYLSGVLQTTWWALAALAGQSNKTPSAGRTRIVAALWLFSGVVFIAYFQAWVTSSLTIQRLRTDINGPEDLPGKRVGTITGSTSLDYLQQHQIRVSGEFTTSEEAFKALRSAEVDAVVYDAPVLQYYASHDGSKVVQVVGPIFRRESYGIVFPSNSPYRKLINGVLLKIKEDGTYDRIYAKWFGGKGT